MASVLLFHARFELAALSSLSPFGLLGTRHNVSKKGLVDLLATRPAERDAIDRAEKAV